MFLLTIIYRIFTLSKQYVTTAWCEFENGQDTGLKPKTTSTMMMILAATTVVLKDNLSQGKEPAILTALGQKSYPS